METQTQKEVHVIRLFFIILFLFSIIKLSSQEKIKGNYSLGEGLGNYSFQKEGLFSFEEKGHVAISSYGKGYYLIKNDSLILNYELTKLIENSYYKSKTYFNSSDSIKVELKIYDFDKKPLKKVQISSYPELKIIEPDKDNTVILKFKKESYKSEKKIIVEGGFLDKKVINITLDRNYIIEVFMNKSKNLGFNHPKAIKGQIDKYKILEFSELYIKLEKNGKTMTLKKQL